MLEDVRSRKVAYCKLPVTSPRERATEVSLTQKTGAIDADRSVCGKWIVLSTSIGLACTQSRLELENPTEFLTCYVKECVARRELLLEEELG